MTKRRKAKDVLQVHSRIITSEYAVHALKGRDYTGKESFALRSGAESPSYNYKTYLDFYTNTTAANSLVPRVRVPGDGGIRLLSDTRPACNSAHRGTFFYVAGAAGAKDTVEVCAKDASDVYAWRTIY